MLYFPDNVPLITCLGKSCLPHTGGGSEGPLGAEECCLCWQQGCCRMTQGAPAAPSLPSLTHPAGISPISEQRPSRSAHLPFILKWLLPYSTAGRPKTLTSAASSHCLLYFYFIFFSGLLPRLAFIFERSKLIDINNSMSRNTRLC